MSELEKLMEHKQELIDLFESYEDKWIYNIDINEISEKFTNLCNKHEIKKTPEVNLLYLSVFGALRAMTVRDIFKLF